MDVFEVHGPAELRAVEYWTAHQRFGGA
jgi:hypothetical protein